MIGTHIARGLLALVFVAAACIPGPINRHVLDEDPLREHFYAARDAFGELCKCSQDVVAFESSEPELHAEIDGVVIIYNARWVRMEMLCYGDDAAFVIFAHELAHFEYAHLGGVRNGKFDNHKRVELWADHRAGCAAAIAGVSVTVGRDVLGSYMGSIKYPDGPERADAFETGYDSCRIQDILRSGSQ